jgi:hypothetical protein
MKLQFKKPSTVKLFFWSCWLFSVYFALAELVVRRIGYPYDNTFVYLAVVFMLVSVAPLLEMWRPGFIRKLVKGGDE